MNILAITASSPKESSWACYFDKKLRTFLGDTFSVNWMENVDNFETLYYEKIIEQYNIIKKETNMSTVCMYGDLILASDNISNYLVYNMTKNIDNNDTNNSKINLEKIYKILLILDILNWII